MPGETLALQRLAMACRALTGRSMPVRSTPCLALNAQSQRMTSALPY
jgi:hypothetical protein